MGAVNELAVVRLNQKPDPTPKGDLVFGGTREGLHRLLRAEGEEGYPSDSGQ
jgi:hypothetical protein